MMIASTRTAACCVAAVTVLLGGSSACRHPGARSDAPNASAAADAVSTQPRLSPEQIRMVQEQLRASDIPVDVTGTWDAQTQAGLIQFQERHGFKPTGRLDADTRRQLSLDPPAIEEAEREADEATTRAPDEDRLRLEPPSHPDPQRGPAGNLPEIPGDPSRSAGPAAVIPPTGANRQTHPGAFQACVDRELSRRGLNAYGDPPGTPAREVDDRYEYVTERYRDIGTICSRNPW